jgi:hypothetical protein
MIKTLKALAVAGTVAILASFTVAPATATAATVDYNAQLKQRPQIVHHDGSATVVFWLRCRAGMNVFEYHVGLTQDGVFHSFDAGPAPFLLPCDGTRHKVKVTLGTGLHPGFADTTLNVQIYDPVLDSDVEATDSAHIWLRFRD